MTHKSLLAQDTPDMSQPVVGGGWAAPLNAPRLTSVSWRFNLSGLWSNAGYWSSGVVPGVGNNVLLETKSARTITFASGTGTIQGLTATTDQLAVTGGTLSVLGAASLGAGLSLSGTETELALQGGTATVAGGFYDNVGELVIGSLTTVSVNGFFLLPGQGNFGDSAIFSGGGTLVTSGVTSILDGDESDNSAELDGLTWTNTGTVQLATELDFAGPAGSVNHFNNQGVFDFIASNNRPTIGGGNGSFSNSGTLANAAGVSLSAVEPYFVNTGLVDAGAGTIEFGGGGSFGGTLTGSEIAFFGGTATLMPGVVVDADLLAVESGVVASSNALTLTGGLGVGGGSLSLSGASTLIEGSYDQDGGSASLGGSVIVQGTLTLDAGSLAVTGAALTVQGSFTENYDDNRGKGGTVSLSAGSSLVLGGGVTFTGGSGGAPEIDGGAFATGPFGNASIGPSDGGTSGLILGGGVTWTNYSTVTVSAGILIGDASGGSATIINDGTFTLAAGTAGISNTATGAASSFVNNGLLSDTDSNDILTVSSSFTSSVTSTIDGGGGIGDLLLGGGGSLAGSVQGGHLDLGGVFTIGAASVGGGGVLGLDLGASAQQTGTVTLGDTTTQSSELYNSGTYALLGSSAIVASGTAQDSVFNDGLLEQIGAGRSVISTSLTNQGTVLAGGGTLALLGHVSNQVAGLLEIGAGATLELGAFVSNTQTIDFLSTSGTLRLDTSGTLAPKIEGFTVDTVIDLVNTTANKATVSNGTLSVFNGSTLVEKLNLLGTHSGDVYSFASDGHGGTLLGIASNSSTWSGVSADWNTAADWNHGVPGPQTNAVVNGTKNFTLTLASNETATAGTLALSDANATTDINGTLAIGTKLALTAGTLTVGGILSGGTLAATGGTLDFVVATLVNETIAGALNLKTAIENLTISGPLTMTGSGAGTINLTGASAVLQLDGVQAPAVTVLNIGNASGTDFLSAVDVGQGGVLALTAAINQSGTFATILDSGGGSDGIFSAGTLTAGVKGGKFSIYGNQFENDGLVKISNGDLLAITSGTVVNTGSISLNAASLTLNDLQNFGSITASGGTLTLTGSLDNEGSITTSKTALVLDGTITTAQLVQIEGSGDSVSIGAGGYLDNTGATMTSGSGSALGQIALYAGGTIEGGTIVDQGNGITGSAKNSEKTYGVLSDVTYEGTLTVQAATGLSIAGSFGITGAGGTGPGTIIDTGSTSDLAFIGSRTLDNVSILLGNNANYSYLDVNDVTGNGATLTLGPDVSITSAGTYGWLVYAQADDAVVNDGSILWNSASGSLLIAAAAYGQGSFSNAGSVTAANGATVEIDASLTNLSGATLTGGSFEADASSSVTLYATQGITTDQATLTLSGTGSDIGTSPDVSSPVTLDQSLTSIGNAGVLNLLAGRVFVAGAGAFTDGGLLLLGGGGSFQDTAGLTLTSTGVLAGNGFVLGPIVNDGLISATGGAYAGGELGLDGSLSGTGVLEVLGGATLDLDAGGTNALPTILTPTEELQFSVGGVAFDLDLLFAGDASSGQVVAITGTVGGERITGIDGSAFGPDNIVGGASPFVDGNGLSFDTANGVFNYYDSGGAGVVVGSINGFVDNAPTLTALSVSAAGTLELTGGTYTLGAAAPGVSAIAIDSSADFSGSGGLTPSLADSGVLEGSSGTLTLNGALTGSGTVEADSGAVVNLAGGGSFGGMLSGAGTIDISTPFTLSNGATISASVVQTTMVAIGAGASVTNSGTFDLSAGTGQTVAVTDAGNTVFSNNGLLEATGLGSATFGVELFNGGQVTVSGDGTMTFLGSNEPDNEGGTFTAQNGLLVLSRGITGNGTLAIGYAGTLSLAGFAGNSQMVDFLATAGGRMNWTTTSEFTDTIQGFAGNDVIDLTKDVHGSFSFANGTLSVTNSSGTVATLNFGTGYTKSDFSVTVDGNGGTLIKFV